jgi:hypothetical protein
VYHSPIIHPDTDRLGRAFSRPPQPIQQPLRLGRRHPQHPKRADLRPTPQPLQALRDLPALLVRDDEDVFLALWVTDRGAEEVFVVALTRL